MTKAERIKLLESEVRELQASKADAYPVWDVARTTRRETVSKI